MFEYGSRHGALQVVILRLITRLICDRRPIGYRQGCIRAKAVDLGMALVTLSARRCELRLPGLFCACAVAAVGLESHRPRTLSVRYIAKSVAGGQFAASFPFGRIADRLIE